MKKGIKIWGVILLAISLLVSGCQINKEKKLKADIDKLLLDMTLEEKVGQMLQVERADVKLEEFSRYYIGSVLSGGGSTPAKDTTDVAAWLKMINDFQTAASKTPHHIPIIYGIDAIHGHNNLASATIFPHNIGLGSANDAELMKKIGAVTAKEMRATGITWTFAPCMPVAKDPRWGRFYESYGDNVELTAKLSSALIEGLQANGVAACAKHYIGDGLTKWGTGMNDKIDRGNVELSEEEIRATVLPVYKEAIEKGVKTIMVSYSSLDGVKMHENKYWITDVLKEELGFEGFVVSDYEAIHELKDKNLYQQVVAATNAGVDMFMEPKVWREVYAALLKAVDNGDITEDRITDAARRIIRVKFEMGLFEKAIPQVEAGYTIGSKENREIAKEAVRKSLVLLKNKQDILPLKKDSKFYVVGPAADDIGVQCGGWTVSWQGGEKMTQGTSILQGLKEVAGDHIITDKAKANEADVVILIIGEEPYAEYNGDNSTLALDGVSGLNGNLEAVQRAKALGKPIVTVMVAGRPMIVTEQINAWDAFVMAWLPGSEGRGIAEMLFGEPYDFTGRLTVDWPKSSENLPIKNADDILFEKGYGLNNKK